MKSRPAELNAEMVVSVTFGVILAMFGFAHYMDIEMFKQMTMFGFVEGGVMASLAGLWAYILPFLMIVGGLLIAVGYRYDIALWVSGVALASIAIGMTSKAIIGTMELKDAAPHVQAIFIWLLMYAFVAKSERCK